MIDIDSKDTGIQRIIPQQTELQKIADKIVKKDESQQKFKMLTITTKKNMEMGHSNAISKQPLPKPEGEFDITSAEIMMAQIRSKLSEQVDKGSITDIRLNMQRLKSENKKLIAKLQEHLKKLEEAKHRSIWAKIFGWIGAVIGVIVGAVAAVFTGGASLGLLVAGIVGMTVCVLNETGTLQKITQALAKAIEKSLISDGVSPEKAKKIAMILSQVVVAAVVIAASIGAAAAGSGVGPLVQLSERVLSMVQMGTRIGTGAASLSGIGAGTSQIMAGISQGESMKVQAQTIDLKSLIGNLQSVLNANVKNLDDLAKGNNQIMSKINHIISTQLDSRRRVIENV